MKLRVIILLISTLFCIITSLLFVFSDPVVPPPPPPTTSYTYILMDQFRTCGPQNNQANYCSEYYLRQKVVSSSTSTSISDSFVCGKDSRCSDGVPCEISSPNDNNRWQSRSLSSNWICPDGFGIAQMHQPGNLNPNFDTINIASPSIIGGGSGYHLNDETLTDLYFNSYIPACVNRIPMMNFEAYLRDSLGSESSNKVGLYALHETLDYDANPLGGVLKNFNISNQEAFRKQHSLVGDLRTYRMWSFRERFTEGLIRTVNQKNLQIPGNINVDALASNSDHDFEEIYFSRDYMLGSFDVANLGGFPIGTDIIQSTKIQCNLDVNNLGMSSISSNSELNSKLSVPSIKAQVIDSIKNNNLCPNINTDMNIVDMTYIQNLNTVDSTVIANHATINDIDSIGVSKAQFNNIEEFESWSLSNRVSLSSRLRGGGILNSNEGIRSISSFERFRDNNVNILIDPSDLGFSDSSDLYNYIDTLSNSNFDTFSDDLSDEGYIGNRYLLKDVDSISIEGSDVRLVGDFYNSKVRINGEIVENSNYDGFSQVELQVQYEAKTTASWSWRSLEDLTLTLLARCLYNWDECLFNAKNEPGVSWQMNEVADLGYGPAMNSIAFQWSANELMSKFSLAYGFHFDGARGFNSNSLALTTYRSCDFGDEWVSSEGYYSCFDETIYKCHFSLSSDEIELGVKEASIGNTIFTGTGAGYVCHNVNISGVLEPRWSVVSCPIP